MFRLLGLHPGPDIPLAAAASLAAVRPERARVLLAELTRAHLLTEHVPGRYAFHDLLRAYARELARAHDHQDARDAAVGRVLDHYLHTTHQAATLMEPFHPIAVDPPQPGVIAGELTTVEDAMAWFTSEQATLLAAVPLAGRTGPSTRVWQFVWPLSNFLLRRGLWDDQAKACQTALNVARQAGDITGEAHCLLRLAIGYAKSGRTALCQPLLGDALRLFEAIGDLPKQALVHRTLLWMAERQKRPAEMLTHSRLCHDLYRMADHRAGQALALQDIGHTYALLGNYEEAIAHCERALAMMREMDASAWEGAIWDTLGYTHHRRGDYEQAVVCYERALDLAREFSDRFNEADTLNNLGDVHRSAGDLAGARRAWTQALRIFDEIDHPDRDWVRAKLRVDDHGETADRELAAQLNSA